MCRPIRPNYAVRQTTRRPDIMVCRLAFIVVSNTEHGRYNKLNAGSAREWVMKVGVRPTRYETSLTA